jgi:hypothetical protein
MTEITCFLHWNPHSLDFKTVDFKAGDIPVSVADIEDVVEGNIYDHEGAD